MFRDLYMFFEKLSRSKFFYVYVACLTILFAILSVYYAGIYSPFGKAVTLTVTNLNNGGAGSLRDAFDNAQNGDIVAFSVSGTINLSNSLIITKSVTATAENNITLNGASIFSLGDADGACIYINGDTGGNTVTISGFQIENCPGDAIKMSASSYGNVIGGDTAIERNILINNADNGIYAHGYDNIIIGNYIGIASDGLTMAGNGASGIKFDGEYYDNTIGGLTSVEANYISGNTQFGIDLSTGSEGDVIDNNKVYGNIIGLNVENTIVANGNSGIHLASTGAYIGDDIVNSGNVISGNTNTGIRIEIEGNNNFIKSNIIGLASDGLSSKANGSDNDFGIEVYGTGNQIGSTNGVGKNVISGNGGDGIGLFGSENIIEGNIIGLNIDGVAIISNNDNGIKLNNSSENIIRSNTISGNGSNGIFLENNANNNLIISNRIGVGESAVVDLGNISNGIYVNTNSSNNMIGIDNGASATNIIAYNDVGVSFNSDTNSNTMRFNSIFDNDNGATTTVTIRYNPPTFITSNTSILSTSLDSDIPDNSYVDYYYDDGNGQPKTYIGTAISSSQIASIIGPFVLAENVVANVTGALNNDSSMFSDSVEIIQDTASPNAPVNLSALASDTTVVLDWDDNTENDLDDYSIYRTTSSPVIQAAEYLVASGLISSTYSDTEVVNGVSYYYAISAFDVVANESTLSNEVNAIPFDSVAPLQPVISSVATADAQITINWDANTEIDLNHYDLYRSVITGFAPDTLEFSNRVVSNLSVSTLTYLNTELINGLTYYYKLIAYDNSGNASVASDEVSATPIANSLSTPGSGGGSNMSDYSSSINASNVEISNPELEELSQNLILDTEEEQDNLIEQNTIDNTEINETDAVGKNDEVQQNDVNISIDTIDQNLDLSSNENDESIEQLAQNDSNIIAQVEDSVEVNTVDTDLVAFDEVVPVSQNIEVEGIPLMNTEETNDILTNVKTNVLRVDIVEDVTECNLNYYGNQEVYNEILDVYGLTDSQALYFDIDDDELNAMEECEFLTNPLLADTDNDALTDGEEFYNYYTDPLKEDTDSDGYSDGIEIEYKTDPLDPNSFPSTCDLIEEFNLDTDSDGLPNYIECQIGSDPENNDTDADGLNDASEYIDYKTNPLIKDDNLKLQITFPSYDTILSTSKPFFQCVAKEGQAVSIILQKELYGERFVLGTLISGAENKCIYDVKDPLLDGTYYVSLETDTERSLPVRFKIDTSFATNDIFEVNSLGGKEITDKVLSGEEVLEIDNNNPDFIATLFESKKNNRVQLIWHSVVTGAVAIRDSAGRISARPPHQLEEGRHDLYASVLDANNNQRSYIKIDFDVNTSKFFADFEGRNMPLYLILIFFTMFMIASYYIYFKHSHPHAIYISQKDIINHVTTYIHDEILRKINYKE